MKDDVLFLIKELDEKVEKLKRTHSKEMAALKRQNSLLKTKLKELSGSQLTFAQVDQHLSKKHKLKQKLKDLRNECILESEFSAKLDNHETIRYILEHFSELDRLSMTKKQYKRFSIQLDSLRNQAAQLVAMERQLQKLSKYEKDHIKLARGVAKIQAVKEVEK